MITIGDEKKSILIRLEKEDLALLDRKVSLSGMSRQRFVTELIRGVLNLDCRPSEYAPFEKAYNRRY